jgi:hypothetical protein
MLTALILICSATVAHDLPDCSRSNARVVMSVPLGQDLGTDQVKIVCVRSATVVAAP